MDRILPGVCSLEQHQQRLGEEPERYRPERCPDCGKVGLWAHGAYRRKADREGAGAASHNPVSIPRFYCAACGCTCSRLPECVAPRRWYRWAMQQGVLALLLAGASIRKEDAVKEIHPLALFRLSVLGPLLSREQLAHGELKGLVREQAARLYGIPGSRRAHSSEKTIEAWLYTYRRDGLDGLVPKPRTARGRSKIPA